MKFQENVWSIISIGGIVCDYKKMLNQLILLEALFVLSLVNHWNFEKMLDQLFLLEMLFELS